MQESLYHFCIWEKWQELLNEWVGWGCPVCANCAEGYIWRAAIYFRAGKQKRGCPVCVGVVSGKRRAHYEKMLAQAKEVTRM